MNPGWLGQMLEEMPLKSQVWFACRSEYCQPLSTGGGGGRRKEGRGVSNGSCATSFTDSVQRLLVLWRSIFDLKMIRASVAHTGKGSGRSPAAGSTRYKLIMHSHHRLTLDTHWHSAGPPPPTFLSYPHPKPAWPRHNFSVRFQYNQEGCVDCIV